MLDLEVGFLCLGSGKFNHVPSLLETVLGDQAKCLGGFLGLRCVGIHLVKNFVKVPHQFLGLESQGVFLFGVVVDNN